MDRPRAIRDFFVQEGHGYNFVLNGTGPGWFVATPKGLDTLWLCDGSRTLDEVLDGLGKKYDMPRDALGKDAEEMLVIFARQGFMENTPRRLPDPGEYLAAVYFHLTRKCNLRCRYCYLDGGDGLDEEMDADGLKDAADQAMALAPPGGRLLAALSGGEPMLHPGFWEIADHLRSGGAAMVLATNGTLVTDENAGDLKERFFEIQVSLDGAREVNDSLRGRGSYDAAVRAVKTLADAGARVRLSATVSKRNIDAMGHLVDLALELGAVGVKHGLFMPFGRGGGDPLGIALGSEDLDILWDNMKGRAGSGVEIDLDDTVSTTAAMRPVTGGVYSCGAGVNSLSIDADGKVYPCQSAHLPEFCAGSLKERSLERIWRGSEVLAGWREGIRVENLTECGGCRWLRYCGGGCRAQAYALSGSLAKPVHYCGHLKDFYASFVDAYLKSVARDEGAPETARRTNTYQHKSCPGGGAGGRDGELDAGGERWQA